MHDESSLNSSVVDDNGDVSDDDCEKIVQMVIDANTRIIDKVMAAAAQEHRDFIAAFNAHIQASASNEKGMMMMPSQYIEAGRQMAANN